MINGSNMFVLCFFFFILDSSRHRQLSIWWVLWILLWCSNWFLLWPKQPCTYCANSHRCGVFECPSRLNFVLTCTFCVCASITTILRTSSICTGTVRNRHTSQPQQTVTLDRVIMQRQVAKSPKSLRRKKKSPKARLLSRYHDANSQSRWNIAHRSLLILFQSSLRCSRLNLPLFRLPKTWSAGLKHLTSRKRISRAAFSPSAKRRGRRQQLQMPASRCLKRRWTWTHHQLTFFYC